MEISQMSAEELFFQISLECCADGKVSAEEFELLRRVSALLKLEKDKANEIANRAVSVFKSGQLSGARTAGPDLIYQELLLQLCADGVLDAQEDAVLQSLKQLLGCDTKNFHRLAARDDQRKIRMKPLVCTNCKGLLPLKKSEWIECPYCAKKNSIPVSYLDAILTRASLNRHKSQLHEIRDAVGRMPTFFETVVSYFPDSMIFFLFALFVLFFQHYLNVLLFYPLSLYYKKHLLQSFYEFSNPMFLAFIKAAALYVMLSIPFAFVYRLQRKISVLVPLQISLAAGAPAIPGGPATCNNCGGALQVEHDSHVVTCVYCETENLVGLPDKWLQMARSRLAGVQKSSAEAIRNFKHETGRLYETLFSLAILFVIYGFILGSLYDNERADHFLPQIKADEAHRSFIYTDSAARPPLKFADWNLIPLTYASAEWKSADLFLFVNAGEKFAVVWRPDEQHFKELQSKTLYLRDLPVPDRMTIALYRAFFWDFSGKNVMKKLQSLEVFAEKEIEFTAEISGYYQLRCNFPEHLPQFYLRIARVKPE